MALLIRLIPETLATSPKDEYTAPMTTTEIPTTYRSIEHNHPGWTLMEILAGDKVVWSQVFSPAEIRRGSDVVWAEWFIARRRVNRLGGITAAQNTSRGETSPVARIICDAPRCSVTTDSNHPGGWVHVEHLRPTNGGKFGGWNFCSWEHLADT